MYFDIYELKHRQEIHLKVPHCSGIWLMISLDVCSVCTRKWSREKSIMLAFWSSVFLLWRFQFRIWFIISDVLRYRSKLGTFNLMYCILKSKIHCNTMFLHHKHGKEALEVYLAGLSLLFPSGLTFQAVRWWHSLRKNRVVSSGEK